MYRQLMVYLLLIVAAAAITTATYFHFRSHWILFHRGEDLYLKKEFKASITYYEAAMAAGVNTRSIYQHLGDVYTEQKRFTEAANLYRHYLTIDPQDREMRIRLARVLSYEGNFEESTQEYQKTFQDSKKEP